MTQDIQVIHSPHPILPEADRRQFAVAYQDGDTLATLLARSLVNTANHPTVVQLNGVPIAPEDYATTFIKPTDTVTIRASVQGGDGSNIIAAVLMIVLIIYAPYMAPALAGAIGVSVTVAQGLIIVGGSLLIGALFPPAIPKFHNGDETSPTYALEGGSNQPRTFQPLPLVIGRHKIIPDLGAAPYVEFDGDDQILFQVFNFGLSDIELSDFKIGETPVENYTECFIEESGPDGKLTLFPGNVDSVAGGELHFGEDIYRTTSVGTVAIGVDIQGSLFATNKKGEFIDETVVLKIEYREVGSETWTSIVAEDPYQPQYEQHGRARVEVPGVPAGVQLTNGTTKPLRRSFYRTVPEGQYEVRVQRLTQDAPNTDSKRQSSISFSALRSYQQDTADYTGQKRVAVRIKASGQLQGRIDQFSAIAQAQCPVYNGTDWLTQPTSNPAWWCVWAARGKRSEAGRRLYGAGLPDYRIDLPTIIEWAAWCDAHELECNLIFDRSLSVDDMFATIARCGRGSRSWGPGKLSFVWDQEGLPVTQMFGMSNIRQGSFKIDYISEKLADEIVISFINPELNWKLDTVRVLVDPENTTPINSVSYDIPGVTSKDQAGREANLQAAAQRIHRRRVSFEADGEGLVCSRGTVIVASHDLANWGVSGRLAAGSTATVLKLDKEITFTADTQPWVSVRHPNGQIEAVTVIPGTIDVPTDTLTLEDPLITNPSTDPDNAVIDYLWQFDPAATPGRKLKVIHMEPTDSHGDWVRIIARDENPAYYDAEDGDYVYVSPGLLNVGNPEITNVQITEQLLDTTRQAVRIFVTWNMKSAEKARVRVAKAYNVFEDYGEISGNSFSFIIDEPTTITVELSPVSLARLKGPVGVVTTQYTIRGLGDLPENIVAVMPRVTGLQLFGDPTGTLFTGNDAKFTWRKVASSVLEVGSELQGADSGTEDPYFKDYEVKVLDTSGNVRRTETVKDNLYTYSFEKNKDDGLGTPVRTFTIEVRARGMQNQVSDAPARLTVSNPAPPVPGGISVQAGFQMAAINYLLPSDTDFVGVVVWASPVSGFTPGEETKVLETNTNTAILTGLTSGLTYYIKLAGYDRFGQDGLTISSEFAATPYVIEATDLNEEIFDNIDAIDDIAADLAQEVIDRANGDIAEATARGTAIASEAALREDADGALASTISSVSAVVGTNTAAIVDETTARISGDSALSSSLTALATTVGTNTSAIATEATTRATADSALSASISSLTATVGTNTADISAETIARTTADSAFSASLSTLSTTVSGHTTSISTVASSVSGIEAKYTVKIDNNGYVSGYGLISTANNGTPTSQFQVLADSFAIFNGSSAVNPFTVSGGTVYMTNAVANNFAAGSILGTHIAAAQIDATKMVSTELSAIFATIGTFQSAGSGQRLVIQDALIRVYDSAGTLRVRMGIW